MSRPLSITLRLTLSFALASFIILLGVGQLVTVAMERHFEALDATELDGKLELVRHALSLTHDGREAAALSRRLQDALVGHHALSVRVQAPDGQVLVSTGEARFPDALLKQALAAEHITPSLLAAWSQGARHFHGVVVAVPSTLPGQPPFRVGLALDMVEHQAFISALRRAIWLAVLLGTLVAALLAWFVAHRALAPVRSIAQLARSISAQHLDARLPAAEVPVELNDLAQSFNDMLARLGDAFRRLSEFSSDLAHELRTPISNLMTQTQVVLSRARSADDYRETLYSSLEEYQRLASMIDDMLFLAKADNGLIMPSRAPVDLAQEIASLFAFYEILAEERGVQLVCRGTGEVVGDRLMLRRALSNLLANAIHHTPRGGQVQVEMGLAPDGWVTVAVTNPGPPIPPDKLERIFDRFYRIDPARTRSGEGAGLGLAITRSIARAHGGDVRVRSGQTTCFELRLPAAAATATP
ncbi:heavy metal sensor histidine kinase [Thiobacter aerophilum]|uniref:Sensor protein n=1 Tax=Thiobacter aerophilum TaxID=3121275 RepID=A0ABV0ECC2_9BURK